MARSRRRSARPLVPLALALALSGCAEGEVKVRPRADKAPAGPKLDPAVERAIAAGDKLFFDRAACSACHKVGKRGGMIVGPNLGVGDGMEAPLAVRAKTRRPELAPIEYVVESMLDPDALVVPTYAPAVMKAIDDLPSALSDDEVVAVAAFVASQGAEAPLEPADLERARAQIPRARASREARRAASAAAADPAPETPPAPSG